MRTSTRIVKYESKSLNWTPLTKAQKPRKNNWKGTFVKLFQPMKYESNDKNVITFTRTCIANYHFSFNHYKNCIKDTTNRELPKTI